MHLLDFHGGARLSIGRITRIFFLAAFFALALSVSILSPQERVHAKELNGCTPGTYHLLSTASIPDTGYVEIYADGCGWIQGHIHTYRADYLEIDLVNASTFSVITSYKPGSQVFDAWTLHISTHGTYYFARGIDNSNASLAATASANGYYYPCTAGSPC